MKLCAAEYAVMERVCERDEGDFTGQPPPRLLTLIEMEQEPEQRPVSIRRFFDDCLRAQDKIGKARTVSTRWKPVFESPRKHLGHDDANRVRKRDLLNWRNDLLDRLAPATVSGVYLAAVRTVFKWSVENDLLEQKTSQTACGRMCRRDVSIEKEAIRPTGQTSSVPRLALPPQVKREGQDPRTARNHCPQKLGFR